MGLTAAETNRRSHDTEALYREHGTAVARLCRSLLRDRAEAEDATQQVFLSAHRALLKGAAPREPLPWLLAVARNECYARFRQRASAPLPAAETPDGATADASVHVLQAGELANVWDEIGRMPPTQREAFLLREIRGLSYGQLADELSLSPPSVRSLLLRARTRLRRRLGDVAAVLGGAPWVQALLRLGGDGASPLPAATKAAAVGVGALALVGGGSLIARHASRTPADAGARPAAHAHVRRVAAPAAATPLASGEAHRRIDGRGSELARSAEREDRSGGSGSDRSGSSGESGTLDTSSGDRPSGSGSDGSNDSTAVAQPTTDGHDGGTSSSSGSDSTSDGMTSGSSSGGDSTATTTTTTTTTTSSGSGGGGTDGGLSDAHGG
jgi:RNA polymerase sigma-70 factor (ECF subfamily)